MLVTALGPAAGTTPLQRLFDSILVQRALQTARVLANLKKWIRWTQEDSDARVSVAAAKSQAHAIMIRPM